MALRDKTGIVIAGGLVSTFVLGVVTGVFAGPFVNGRDLSDRAVMVSELDDRTAGLRDRTERDLRRPRMRDDADVDRRPRALDRGDLPIRPLDDAGLEDDASVDE